MKQTLIKLLLIFIILTSTTYAYPQKEIYFILKEKYPDADFDKDIILRDDGQGVYVAYNYSAYPIPGNTEMESLWQQVQAKRISEAQNKSIADRIKQNYTQAMTDLDTIQNGNPQFTQAGFNQVVWAQKRTAEILEDILRFMKWYFWGIS